MPLQAVDTFTVVYGSVPVEWFSSGKFGVLL